MLKITLPNFISDLLSAEQGGKSSTVRIPAEKLADVHAYFAERHPNASAKMFETDGSVRKNVILVLNDELLSRSEYSATAFNDGDELSLLVQFAGG
ncbi:MoaD/ThiS family protein [Streptomyces sp. NPDC088923]|uniref:MoaD/ThiS family protein n=1 Tax=Streptomyces sp. NPDC088923 TaxID=3365913 RepID=UPI003816322D